MKRSEELKPLSREHHQALFTAKAIRDQAGGGDSRERFLRFWHDEGRIHFRIEEEVLLPGSGLVGPDIDEDVARMLSDHLTIRRAASRVESGQAGPDELLALADRLTAHVRFEERDLFPRIEGDLPEPALRALGEAIERAEAAERRR